MPPLSVKPIPLPAFASTPSTCPCYLVEPGSQDTKLAAFKRPAGMPAFSSLTPENLPPGAVIGTYNLINKTIMLHALKIN